MLFCSILRLGLHDVNPRADKVSPRRGIFVNPSRRAIRMANAIMMERKIFDLFLLALSFAELRLTYSFQ